MPHLVIIGAGPMGLASAYYALRAGFEVTVLEAADRPGGMAAHFDFDGISLERYYHFCCRSDIDTLHLMDKLDLSDKMCWKTTRMGFYVDGKLYRFGDPVSLLKFSPLNLIEKLRYGLMAYMAMHRSNWHSLDKITAREWIIRSCGKHVYEKLWRPLLELKFHDFADDISAAWVWQRINRLGRSRRSMFTEELGYIDGGSQTLIDALVNAIKSMGGEILLSSGVKRICASKDSVNSLILDDGCRVEADYVFSTAPLRATGKMLKHDLPELSAVYSGFDNIGVACVIHRLSRSVSDNFWVNVSDKSIEIPGFVEFSNLRKFDDVIVYVPYYMPVSHPKFSWLDADLLDESFKYLQCVNPSLNESHRIAGHVGRLTHAQPVCTPGFSLRLPDVKTPVRGLWIADTSFYYPEDRGVSESIRFARETVSRLEAERQ